MLIFPDFFAGGLPFFTFVDRGIKFRYSDIATPKLKHNNEVRAHAKYVRSNAMRSRARLSDFLVGVEDP